MASYRDLPTCGGRATTNDSSPPLCYDYGAAGGDWQAEQAKGTVAQKRRLLVMYLGASTMDIAFFGDSLTAGKPGASYYRLLCRMLPEYKLHNYGHGGDSVIGAYDRVARLRLEAPFDIAFVWIGTNDVFAKVSWTFPVIRRFMGLPWTRSQREFESIYRMLLEELCYRSRAIYTVAPWFVGEKLDNPWNNELDELAAVVQAVSADFEDTTYLDIRALFRSKLAEEPVSGYAAPSALTVGWDTLWLKEVTAVDQKAEQRGLKITLDGVHLNSVGAKMVAEYFAKIIKRNAPNNSHR